MAGQLDFADFASFLDSPGDQPVLLVIDNCEHVLDAAADVIERTLAACSMPRILATSRTALDLDGESILALGPLATPGDLVTGESASMRLFAARARDHGVDIGEDDLELAAEICRRLDGVPLAIELAAARLRTVGLAEVLAELETAPHALARRRHRGQASHRSVGDLVNWSYDLLTPDEQAVFRGLGVFAGPFTRALAVDVVGAASDLDVDAAIDGLVDASLVVVDRVPGVARYRLLHPVRAVAADALDRAGEAAAMQSRLVDAICDQTLAIVRGGPNGWNPDDLHGLLDLYDHCASSIRWAIEHDGDPDRALTLVAVLWGIVHNAHSTEILALGEAVLARWPDRDAPRWPHAAATVSTCRFLVGDTAGAIELAETTMPFADRSRAAPSLLRRVVAQSRRAAGDLAGANAMFREAADLAEARGARGLYLELRVDEGLSLAELGDLDAAMRLVEQMVAAAEEAAAPINISWARVARASLLRQIDAAGSLPAIEAALAEARDIDYPAGITFALRLLAAAKVEAGETIAPAAALLELLDSLLQRGGLDEMRVVLDLTAELMRRNDMPDWSDVAATAATFPVTSFIAPTTFPFLPAEPPPGKVLSTRDAYVTARRALLELSGPGRGAPTVEDASPAARPGRGASADAEMVSEGDVWRLTFATRTIRLKHTKGLGDLAVLLAAPGREISVLDLAGAGVVAGAEDELLDARARREYEERIRDVHGDIEEAEANHDTARAELLQAELDALVEQLAGAVGLGGRGRRTAGSAERARSAVTQRVRGTIKRIEEAHPELGDHLHRSVTTGLLCSYSPQPAVVWIVRPIES